jgi:hypothetical protein
MNVRRAVPLVPAALAAILGAGCGAAAPSEPRAAFAGVYASGSETGRLDLTIAHTDLTPRRQDLIDATGRLTAAGIGSLMLAGTYEPTSRVVYLTGGRYVLNGYVEERDGEAPYFEGEFFGPHSVGGHILMPASTAPPVVLCGSYGGDDAGKWSVVVGADGSAGAVAGSALRRGARHVLTGRRDEASLTLAEAVKDWTAAGEALIASGAYDPTRRVAAGRWTRGGLAGSWSASECSAVP